MEKSGKSERLDSAMFRDESRAPKSKREKEKEKSERLKSEKYKSEPKVESVKYKSEKKKVEKIIEEEYTEEPDFSDFVSKYELPEEVKKVEKKSEKEKKAEKSAKPEVYKSDAVESKYESVKVEPSAKYESKKVDSKIKSVANFKTAFTDNHDIEMAAKQTQIMELIGQELEEQEQWAFEKLKAHAGSCPMGFSWQRYTEEACGEQERLDGYRCMGGSHLVTHELIAEGKGRTMDMTRDFAWWRMDMEDAQDPHNCPVHGTPMPPPFTGVRWEFRERRPLQRRSQQLGLSGPATSWKVTGGSGSGGLGSSPFDPSGHFSLPQATRDFLNQQYGQPGRQRLSVLDPNYNPNQADDEDVQQQQHIGYGGPLGNGGQGGLFGRGYNGKGGGGAGGSGGRRR